MMNGPFPSLKVLAVDDNRTNLHILSVFLKKLGHEIVVAENGQEALDLFAEKQPDIVLLDIMMPVLDGFEVARRIKAQSQGYWIPIIFLSALNGDENLVEGLEAGGDDYLTKPISFVVLEAKMRSMQRALMLQQRAIESFKRLQAVSDNVREAILTMDAEGKVLACNAATEQVFGWTAADLIGQGVGVLMAEAEPGEHDLRVRRYIDGGPSHVIGTEREVEARRRDGTVFVAELGVTELHLENSRLFIGVVRDITERKRTERKLKENADQLQAYFDHTQAEQALALSLMEKQLHRPGLRDSRLRYTVLPAEHFSGDIVAAVRSAKGRLYVLLGDATGHGLPAAITAMPILALFYRMAEHDRAVAEIVRELNSQLRQSMPSGRFVALSLVCLDEEQRHGEIWIGGTPEALMLDGDGLPERIFPSRQLPLGIVDDADFDSTPETFAWTSDRQILLCSDGVAEAFGPGGNAFGNSGIRGALKAAAPDQRFDRLLADLNGHLAGTAAADDISIMLIDCR